MTELKTLEEKVERVLMAYPRTRNDDRELTLTIWEKCYGVNPWSPINEVMRNKSLPSQESLGRIRRKLQQHNEALRGTKRREKIRLEAQKDYMDYVKGE